MHNPATDELLMNRERSGVNNHDGVVKVVC